MCDVAMTVYDPQWTFNTNDLVWAQMKWFPAWPGIVVEPSKNIKNSGKKKSKWIRFFGTNDYGWIEVYSLRPYYQFKHILSTCCKSQSFKKACEAIEKYIDGNNIVDPKQLGVQFNPDMPQSHQLEFAKSNTEISKPVNGNGNILPDSHKVSSTASTHINNNSKTRQNCAVKNCKQYSNEEIKHDSDVSFHRFPEDSKTRKMWMRICRNVQWHSSFICSMHFETDAFLLSKEAENLGYCPNVRVLKKDAIPTLNLPRKSSQKNGKYKSINGGRKTNGQDKELSKFDTQLHSELLRTSLLLSSMLLSDTEEDSDSKE